MSFFLFWRNLNLNQRYGVEFGHNACKLDGWMDSGDVKHTLESHEFLRPRAKLFIQLTKATLLRAWKDTASQDSTTNGYKMEDISSVEDWHESHIYQRNLTSSWRPWWLFSQNRCSLEEQPLGVWDPTEGVGPYIGGWTILGSQDTKGWRSKSPFSFFGALCPGSLLGEDIEVLPCPSDCGSCSGNFLKLFSSKGGGTRGITVNDPLWAPAFPSVRWGWECFTHRIAENSQWYTWANPCHCGYCGIGNAWINSGHFLLLSTLLLGGRLGKEV